MLKPLIVLVEAVVIELEESQEDAGSTLRTWRKKAQLPLLLFAAIAIPIAALSVYHSIVAYKRTALTKDQAFLLPARRTTSPEFDIEPLTIPKAEIRRGGPPKDGIPALTDPKLVAASAVDFMSPDDLVIGVTIGDTAKAYPLKVLDSHEVVNDTIADLPIAVTYCPLCDSSVVFDRRIGEKTIELGVSGLLYNSNVLMYDRGEPGKEALWSQMASSGVSGWSSSTALTRLPLEVATWQSWNSRYPESLVLSTETGYVRGYNRGVYANYFSSPQLMFPVNPTDDRLPPKTPVIGVIANGISRAYAMTKQEGTHHEKIGGMAFELFSENGALRIERAEEGVEWCYAYWFAWAAFNPETELVLE